MKVLILGSGVIGVTTAYFLQKAGCEVTVLERHDRCALEASHENGSQLSYSNCLPLASKSNLKKAMLWIGKSDAPLLIRPSIDWDMFKWLMKFLFEVRDSKYFYNSESVAKLTFYSKAVLHEMMSEHKFNFDWNNKGLLHIFKTKEDMDSTKSQFDFIAENTDAKYIELTKQKCIDLEPCTENIMKDRYAGILATADETGDVYQFTVQLEEICKKMGVKFLYHQDIESLDMKNGNIVGVKTNRDYFTADKYIVAMGAYSKQLLEQVGIRVPIYPVKGYSLSIDSDENHIGPRSTITDHDKKTVYTKMNNILRVSGTAEFNGYNHDLSQDRLQPMLATTQENFPTAGDFSKVKEWSCLRPLTPSTRPIISKTNHPELYINSGHGFLGWTEAFGSAKLMMHIVLNQKTEIDSSGFSFLNN